MSKYRLFIASSVEGLDVAYAIQENLKYISETTVWSQGIFNLSESSLESLLSLLDTCDFGVFVFTPDDHIMIRGKKDLAIRDNVLFELGLFIGRLGRKSCFIVIPDNKEFHLPTDLIGVTPAKYETSRTDNNLQAATGSASHKIREAIIKNGGSKKLNDEPEIDSQKTVETKKDNNSEDWFEMLFVKKEYDSAIKSLNKMIRNSKDNDDKVTFKGYICYAKFQKDAQIGKAEYEKLINENKTNNLSYLAYANTLFSNNLYSKAIEIIEEGLIHCQRKITLTNLKIDCLMEINQKDEAFEFLNESMKLLKDPGLFIKLSSLFTSIDKKESALEILYNGFTEYPNNEQILYKLARTCYDLGHKDICVLLYKELIKINSTDSTYWTLLGNAYLDLEFSNLALTSYEKANDLANNNEDWILSNIGNLYNNKGFFDKAEHFLNSALKINDKSDYTHARLSQVYLSREEENKKLVEILKSAKAKMKDSLTLK